MEVVKKLPTSAWVLEIAKYAAEVRQEAAAMVAADERRELRAGSVYLNSFLPLDKWISTCFMPPPGLAVGG